MTSRLLLTHDRLGMIDLLDRDGGRERVGIVHATVELERRKRVEGEVSSPFLKQFGDEQIASLARFLPDSDNPGDAE